MKTFEQILNEKIEHLKKNNHTNIANDLKRHYEKKVYTFINNIKNVKELQALLIENSISIDDKETARQLKNITIKDRHTANLFLAKIETEILNNYCYIDEDIILTYYV